MKKINLKMSLLRLRFDWIEGEERNVIMKMAFRKINLASVGRLILRDFNLRDCNLDGFLCVKE